MHIASESRSAGIRPDQRRMNGTRWDPSIGVNMVPAYGPALGGIPSPHPERSQARSCSTVEQPIPADWPESLFSLGPASRSASCR